MRKSEQPRGYTLLEVMVATLIMSVAVVALISNLSVSLNNTARLTDYDRAVLMAKRTMNELLAAPDLPKMTPIEGTWDPDVVGVNGGWRAQLTPFERVPRAGPGQLGLDRIELEVWWSHGGDNRRTLALEAYRTDPLTRQDMEFPVAVP